jgi:hypothetical protein
MHPQPHVQKQKAHELVTTGSPDQSGFPRAMVLTVSFVISPVTGLFCHRRFADIDASHPVGPENVSAKLDASVGASGPHDFAVRNNVVRLHAASRSRTKGPPCDNDCVPTLSRPPHPAPRS